MAGLVAPLIGNMYINGTSNIFVMNQQMIAEARIARLGTHLKEGTEQKIVSTRPQRTSCSDMAVKRLGSATALMFSSKFAHSTSTMNIPHRTSHHGLGSRLN